MSLSDIYTNTLSRGGSAAPAQVAYQGPQPLLQPYQNAVGPSAATKLGASGVGGPMKTPNTALVSSQPTGLGGPTQSFPTQAPSIQQAQQASSAGLTPQQLAIMQTVSQQLAQQKAKAAAAYAATPQGQTQSAINTRGVFAGGQQAAPPAVRPNTQLPPMPQPGGVINRGGA